METLKTDLPFNGLIALFLVLAFFYFIRFNIAPYLIGFGLLIALMIWAFETPARAWIVLTILFLCGSFAGMLWNAGRKNNPPRRYKIVQGYIITLKDESIGNGKVTPYTFVATREIAHRAARTGDYTIAQATYQDSGNHYESDGMSTPGGIWVPGGMLVDDGTEHKYNDERLNK